MSDLNLMYDILKKMIEYAEKRDAKTVLELNDIFNDVSQRVFQNPLTATDLEYDTCRQSCILSLSEENFQKPILDANKRFSKISRPK